MQVSPRLTAESSEAGLKVERERSTDAMVAIMVSERSRSARYVIWYVVPQAAPEHWRYDCLGAQPHRRAASRIMVKNRRDIADGWFVWCKGTEKWRYFAAIGDID